MNQGWEVGVAPFQNARVVEEALSLLGATLEARGVRPYEIVVVGGAAMSVLGFGIRPTKDVDVLALRDQAAGRSRVALLKHKPLPDELVSAAVFVADALGLEPEWLNPGPADLLDFGMPEGFEERLSPRSYGPRLTVLFPSRTDLIFLKTYAAADAGPGRHTEDLQALRPSCEELLAAARWARSHDPSQPFGELLVALLRYFQCQAAAEELLSDG
jgi:hypothetical protein